MYIYKITNLINNKIYIGQCSKPIKNTESYYGSGKWIKRAIRKHCKCNFTKDILSICYSEVDLDEQEIFFIKLFNSTNRNIGYNISHGGSVFWRNCHHSTETKQKISHSSSGSNNHYFGKTHSVEIRRKIKDAIKDKQLYGENHPRSYPVRVVNPFSGVDDTTECISTYCQYTGLNPSTLQRSYKNNRLILTGGAEGIIVLAIDDTRSIAQLQLEYAKYKITSVDGTIIYTYNLGKFIRDNSLGNIPYFHTRAVYPKYFKGYTYVKL